jgi:hypothetical protein
VGYGIKKPFLKGSGLKVSNNGKNKQKINE